MKDYSNKSDDLLNYLVQIAVNDGIISDDEQNFIDAVQNEINIYKNYLTEALKDGKITINEKMKLVLTRKRLMKKALNIVRTDLKITDEEQKLLDGLEQKLNELDEFERKYLRI